jgi:hypothetical protein
LMSRVPKGFPLKVIICSLALESLCSPAAAGAPRGLDLGFGDSAFNASDPQQRETGLEEARTLGARIIRINIRWAGVASTRPLDGADPDDPAYRWSEVDARIRDASSRGFRVLPLLFDAPGWAEGSVRPSSAPRGTWLPDPRAFGQFAEAAARRYRGVTQWQVWNEPNLWVYLSPQWRRVNGRLIAVAPGHYRRMLNAAYMGIKRANAHSRVVTAGTAPYGDPPGADRTFPVTFWRLLLKRPTRFDIYAHHPYSVAGPRRPALNAGDVSVPDLGRLTRIVRAAARADHVLPRARKPLWITELSWDSSPPDPGGVPSTRHARWLTDALYLLWKQGAHAVLWTMVRDAAPHGGYAVTYQGGVLQLSGLAKLAARAFAFPVACERMARGRLRVWGKAPRPGRLRIVRDRRTIRRLTVGRGGVFLLTVRSAHGVHAEVPGLSSLACKPG